MIVEDGREKLANLICMRLQAVVKDVSGLKDDIYIILNDFEITTRCTEIAELKEDRNEYLLKSFLIAKTVKGCTKRTVQFYRVTIANILQKMGKTVDEITSDDIRYYIAIRTRQDHVSKTTAGNEMRCLSSFFKWMYDEEIIRRNPMNRVDKIKKEKTKKEALTDMEIEKLRLAAIGDYEKMIIELLLSTGCRVSVVVNILLSEIDDNKILVHGKGEKDRTVYLNARAILAMNIYLGSRNDNNPYLFPRRKGLKDIANRKRDNIVHWWRKAENIDAGHTDASSVEAITRRIAKRAGVEQANPHKFRRTCATMALRRGMPIEQVSKMLGHEDISTTQIYLDLNEEELEQAHKKYVI